MDYPPSVATFLVWEAASRDTIDVKRIYIDIAGEDLVSGVLLSQLLYWHLPSRQGGARVTVERDGKLWLVKRREDWWDECRITPKQFDRASANLAELKLIEIARFRWRGSPTLHLYLHLKNIAERVNSILTKGRNGTQPLGELDIDERESSLRPETFTEITPEIENPLVFPEKERPSPPPQPGTPDFLVAMYNAKTPTTHPKVKVLSPARRKKALKYLAMFPDLAWWEEVFRAYGRSPFLRGEKVSEGHAGFRADFDWLLSKGRDGTENCVKVADGKYDETVMDRAVDALGVRGASNLSVIERMRQKGAYDDPPGLPQARPEVRGNERDFQRDLDGTTTGYLPPRPAGPVT